MLKYRLLYLKNLLKLNPGKSILLILTISLSIVYSILDSPQKEILEYEIVTKFEHGGNTKYVITKGEKLEIESGIVGPSGKLQLKSYPLWYGFMVFLLFIGIVISFFAVLFSFPDLNESWDIKKASEISKIDLIKCSEEYDEDGKKFYYYTIMGRLVNKSHFPIGMNDIKYICREDVNINNLNIYPEYLSKSEKRLKKLNSLLK